MTFVGRGGTKGGNRPHEKRSDGRSKWTYVSKVAVFSTFYELLIRRSQVRILPGARFGKARQLAVSQRWELDPDRGDIGRDERQQLEAVEALPQVRLAAAEADGAGEVVDGSGSGTPTPRILVDSASRPARTTALSSAVDGLIDTETFKSDRAAMAV